MRRPPLGREFECGEIEGRRDGTVDQRPVAERPCRLPGVGGHDNLRSILCFQFLAEPVRLLVLIFRGDGKFQRRTRVMVPDLDGVDAMPGRGLAGAQQVINRCARAAPAGWRLVAENLAVMPAFRMRL